MDNSILLAKYIQSILENSDEIKSIIGENQYKIFPLLQPEDLSFPFIVHSRTGMSVQYTKDIQIGRIGWVNIIQYTISCVSDNYVQCLELANAVRHSVETYRYKDEDIQFDPIELLTVTEYMTENNAFVEELQFQCTVK